MKHIKQLRKRTIVCILLCMTLFFTSIHAQDIKRTVEEIEQYLDTVLSLNKVLSISEKSREQMMFDALVKLASENEDSLNKVMKALAGTVDSNSTFIPKDEYNEMMNQLQGQTGGIGITATVKDGFLEIVNVLENSPAAEAALIAGDKVIAVDGNDVTGEAALKATDFLQGKIGTEVKVTILSQDGQQRDVVLKRYAIPEMSVESGVLNGNVGYVKIKNFATNTPEQVENALKDFNQKGIKKLVLDLRNNGGGVFAAGVKVADLFLDKDKTIVTVKGKEEKDQTIYTASEKKYDFDLCMLVNEYTASASEVVIGAIKDNKAGYIMGETTYGKATAQGIFLLGGIGGALKITIQTYLTPSGEFIHGKGIRPDEVVELERKKYTLEELPKLTYERSMKIGDSGDDVKTLETLLDMINYKVGKVDGYFDEQTAKAVTQFQQNAELYPYGVCDITTQSYLREKVLNTTFVYDTQLPAALKYLEGR